MTGANVFDQIVICGKNRTSMTQNPSEELKALNVQDGGFKWGSSKMSFSIFSVF